ncbi:hypothetical protein Hamer_G026576 [Homarus americanus]|uniref:Uncharacterized protein n=1 Tax=Homarus americanus TaxID=6706 RepID=A0A8J5KF18_HOMAM|nr:hypothetical protein Hamer_G026576 [Homarus americanus]
MYREPLRLPGEFTTTTDSDSAINDLHDLQAVHRTITHLLPAPPRQPQLLSTHVPDGLLHAGEVFVRRDATSSPLTPRMTVPFMSL